MANPNIQRMHENEAKITHARVLETLNYSPETGVFTWKYRPELLPQAAARWTGKEAGYHRPCGHVVIRLDGLLLRAHRLAWFYVHGEWPADEIDHASVEPSDNRLDNLRPASRVENACNQPLRANNTSGFKGVSQSRGRWIAYIRTGGRKINLGRFDTAEAAHAAYCDAATAYHGAFARTV